MLQAYRASIVHFIADPFIMGDDALRYYEDGLLIVENGLIKQCGDYSALKKNLEGYVQIIDYSGYLIMPGFIDTHTHYVQTDVIASYGAQLIDWLNDYTFPAECRYNDKSIAKNGAEFYIDQCLKNGTTTSMVFPTVHTESVDALFNAASKVNMRIISGKVLSDRHVPEGLSDTPQSAYDDSKVLIQRWHHKNRFSYAVTPRFAPTSSEAQLEVAGQLFNEFDGVYCQTHVAENKAEVEWVRSLFPHQRSYLDVYAHYGLLKKRSMMAHCLYLDETDFKVMSETQTSASLCPTSNLFLGSGLFSLDRFLKHDIKVSLGSDVGGGTSLNMLQVLNEAYKVCQMNGFSLTSLHGFYLATLGGAKALDCDDKIGNFEKGKEADFIVLDLNSTDIMQRRMKLVDNLQQQLFVLMMLGDDRAIHATYIFGKEQYKNRASSNENV